MKELEAAKLTPRLMVDCSHANSSKQHEKQLEVAHDIADQIAGGSRSVFGVMIESHIEAGAQKFTPGKDTVDALTYGQSITDACLGWAVAERRWRCCRPVCLPRASRLGTCAPLGCTAPGRGRLSLPGVKAITMRVIDALGRIMGHEPQEALLWASSDLLFAHNGYSCGFTGRPVLAGDGLARRGCRADR